MNNALLATSLAHTILESLVVIFFTISILGEWTSDKRKILLIFGIIEGALIILLKSIHMPFGINTIITLFVIALWTYLITKRSYTLCILASSITFGFLIIIELSFVFISIKCLNLEIKNIVEITSLRIMFSMPQIIIMYLLGVVLNKIVWKKYANPFKLQT